MLENALPVEYGERLCRHGDLDRYLIELFGDAYRAYREKWALTCSDKVQEQDNPLPLHVSLELADRCNLRCVFCYRHLSEQTNAAMDAGMFREIMQEIRRLGIPAMDFSLGEPLVHPQAGELIRLAGESGVLDFILTTNGLLLDDAMVDACLDSLTRIHISVDAVTPETYKKLRGGDLLRLERNIHNFLDRREKRGMKHPLVRLSFIVMDSNRHEIGAFVEKWQHLVDYIDFQTYISHDFVDGLADIVAPDPSALRCPDPFRYLSIRADGGLYPCCTFYSKHLLLDKFRSGLSLESVWNSPRMTALRQSFRDKAPCKACLNCLLGATQQG